MFFFHNLICKFIRLTIIRFDVVCYNPNNVPYIFSNTVKVFWTLCDHYNDKYTYLLVLMTVTNKAEL